MNFIDNLTQELPESNNLDINALSRLFDKTTNSYKYIFILSILDILSKRLFNTSGAITFEEIVIEMLANSWYPHSFFKLSFGLQDMIPSQLQKLNIEVGKLALKGDFTGKEYLRQIIASKKPDNSLMDYVPYRVNAAFFRAELKRLPDYKVNSTIVQLSNEYFDIRKPLFKYANNSIIIHPDWISYFKTNYKIVKGWISWEWLHYMQKCNPSVPAISNKLFAPSQRESLNSQTKYWKLILKHQNLICIYSQKPLAIENLSLDHYLPWSFVTHDLLWNLIPTSRGVNSSKSDNLPADKYFHSFIRMQHLGLTVSHTNMESKTWENYIETYIAELKITDNRDLLELEKLQNAYKSTILPQINLAISHGFTPNWTYS